MEITILLTVFVGINLAASFTHLSVASAIYPSGLLFAASCFGAIGAITSITLAIAFSSEVSPLLFSAVFLTALVNTFTFLTASLGGSSG